MRFRRQSYRGDQRREGGIRGAVGLGQCQLHRRRPALRFGKFHHGSAPVFLLVGDGFFGQLGCLQRFFGGAYLSLRGSRFEIGFRHVEHELFLCAKQTRLGRGSIVPGLLDLSLAAAEVEQQPFQLQRWKNFLGGRNKIAFGRDIGGNRQRRALNTAQCGEIELRGVLGLGKFDGQIGLHDFLFDFPRLGIDVQRDRQEFRQRVYAILDHRRVIAFGDDAIVGRRVGPRSRLRTRHAAMCKQCHREHERKAGSPRRFRSRAMHDRSPR
ncbi:hypothetical protein DWU99_10885 [Dyella psychrodurans]|uniref:Uncharacterized protein n=1 Tax=Dyella psychrodurans TaxID=1927960 RepID=A0A370X7K7_9GAMM|nr:hypothetical protein DWU99_10885 [Dyella psychrodurans]